MSPATSGALPRADYAPLTLYAPELPRPRVDLSDNTNRWGMPPAAARALREAAASSFTRYPEPYAEQLKEALAAYVGVDTSNVATGCGSDDVLDSAIRAFAPPGTRVATCDPSFVMVPALARVNGLECVRVPFREDCDVDAPALLRSDAPVIYLCSPNNPTGTEARFDTVASIADATRALVIIDEAYVEFAGRGFLELARTRPNVLVVRTMSKAFGLAGLRVGYGVGAPAVVREIEKARGPFKVSTLASLAARAALLDDVAWMRLHARLARDARAAVEAALAERGIEVLPSAGNFVCAPLRDAIRIAARMRELGVGVRAFANLPGFCAQLRASGGEAIRVTAGPPDEMAALLDALDAARRGA